MPSHFYRFWFLVPTNLKANNSSKHNPTNMKQSTYAPVKQVDDIDDATVIVEVVKPMETVRQEKEQNEIDDWTRAKCAGVVGAIAGCLTGGFTCSLICATGCIYAAKQEGTVGDIARACGSSAIKANVMAREVDNEHQVVDKSKQAAAAVWSKAKDLNREHKIVEKTKDCVVSGVKAGVEFSREHKLVEKTAQGIGKVVSVVAQEVSTISREGQSNDTAPHSDPEIAVVDRVELPQAEDNKN